MNLRKSSLVCTVHDIGEFSSYTGNIWSWMFHKIWNISILDQNNFWLSIETFSGLLIDLTVRKFCMTGVWGLWPFITCLSFLSKLSIRKGCHSHAFFLSSENRSLVTHSPVDYPLLSAPAHSLYPCSYEVMGWYYLWLSLLLKFLQSFYYTTSWFALDKDAVI